MGIQATITKWKRKDKRKDEKVFYFGDIFCVNLLCESFNEEDVSRGLKQLVRSADLQKSIFCALDLPLLECPLAAACRRKWRNCRRTKTRRRRTKPRLRSFVWEIPP